MNTPSPVGTETLAAALRRTGAELQRQQPPAELLGRVRAAVRTSRPPSASVRTPRGGVWAWAGGAGLAGLLGASALMMLRLPPPATVVDDGLRFGAFVTVAPAERWPRGTATAWLVNTELQGERLASLGLPYDPTRAGAPVRAELLLHPSGEVLAVRVLD